MTEVRVLPVRLPVSLMELIIFALSHQPFRARGMRPPSTLPAQPAETFTNPAMHATPSMSVSHVPPPSPSSPSGFPGFPSSSQPVNRNTIISPWTPPSGFSAASGSGSQLGRHTGVSSGRPFMERATTLQQWPTTEPTRSGRTHGIYSSPPPSVPAASTRSASGSGSSSRLPGPNKKIAVLHNYIVCIHTEDVSSQPFCLLCVKY